MRQSGKTGLVAKSLLKRDEVVYVGKSIGQHTIDLRVETILQNNSEILRMMLLKSTPGIKDVGMEHAVFLNHLEGWIDGIISQDGLTDKELIRMIKERYEHSIQANIDHYNYLAKNAKEDDDIVQEARHRLMVRVYQELLPNKSTAL